MTARHRLQNPKLGRISVNLFKGHFGLFPALIIKWWVNVNKSNYLGVKRGNLKLISGLLLPSFILNYMLIRVKERGFE